MESVLLQYARHNLADDLFGRAEVARREAVMGECIDEVASALRTLGKADPWSPDLKVSDEFLAPVFSRFFEKLLLPNMLRKSDYYVLAKLVPKESIDPEVITKLDGIVQVATNARPTV